MTDRDELAAIGALIAGGDDRAAYARLRARLAWPRGKQLDDLAAWLAWLAEVAKRRGSAELAEVVAAAVLDPDSPDRLYDLGYALIDAGAPSIAASVLWHCLALVGDSEEVVCELVSALESALAYGDAFAILEQHGALRGRSFLCEYLYAFNAAMTGRLEVTRAELAKLVPEAPETEAMRATIAAIVERADRLAGVLPLDPRDLRGWHYVLNESLLVHQSPYGFEQPMHGRYAWLHDSIARIATGLERVAPLVHAIAAPCVYAPPGKSNDVLALAASARFGIPVAPWPAIGVPAPGVVVMYDLAALPAGEVAKLVPRRPDQILFAHGSPWTHDAPLAPDVTTMLYETLIAPWGETAVVDDVTGAISVGPPDPRSIEELAAEVIASPGLSPEETASDQPAQWAALVEKAWPPFPGHRGRLWAGGPVPSSRFD